MKTFWSVTYRTLGALNESTAWFDSKEAAKAFADHDFRNDPVAHTFRNAERIADMEQRLHKEENPYI